MSFEMRSVFYSSAMVVLFILIDRAVATDVSLLSKGDVNSPLHFCSRRNPAFDPFHEIRYGQDVVWQIPPNPKAVLFLAHGMSKEPLSFFDPGPNCPQCYGLPEDRRAILSALERDYAVLMVKSVGEWWLPWGLEVWPPPPSEDRTIVVSIIKEWTKEHSLDHLPLAAFGYSSGGNFSSILTVDLDIKSLILMCSPGELEAVLHANTSFPPTLFVGMPADKDGQYGGAVTSKKILESKGVRTGLIDVLPRPIRASNFTMKIACLRWETAEKIYEAYKAEGWLNDNDYVTKNPAIYNSEVVLWKYNILHFCQRTLDVCLAKHIVQEMTVAYAVHSFSSEHNEEIFNWLDDTVFVGSSEPAVLWASQ